MLQQLPSYIELRSPSPEPAPIEVPTSSSPQGLQITSDRQNIESNSQSAGYEVETTCNYFLRDLKFEDILDNFYKPSWHGGTFAEYRFHIKPFGSIQAEQEDTLGTLVDRIYNSGYTGRRVNCIEMVLMLIENSRFSASNLLETVVRKGNGTEVEILKWLALNIDVRRYGARALGKAACLNNFEAVNLLLDNKVAINGAVWDPHDTPRCHCGMIVINYAQLPRLDRDEPGASDNMIAHLLARGAANLMGADMCFMRYLECVLRNGHEEEGVSLSKVQAIVERISGFAGLVDDTGSILETCILRWEQNDTCAERRRQVLDYLLDKGAKTSPGSPLAVSIYTSCPGRLHWGLLDRTENINAYCNPVSDSVYWDISTKASGKHGKVTTLTPLQAAALRGDEGIIRILLQNGADVNCPARGDGGVTALQAVCCLEQTDTRDAMTKIRIVKLLLENGANVNAAPALKYGLTALQAAAFAGDVQLANLLISRGADINAPGCKFEGGTALALAIRGGHASLVILLLNAGAAVPTVGPIFFSDYQKLLDLLCFSAAELAATYGGNATLPRGYREYEAEWANDST